MPVYMKVVIDEREIERLLVECGNSPLTVEVRQLRMLPRTSTPRGAGAEYGTGAGGNDAPNPYLRPVELYGIISIYNPVNRASLGFEDTEEAGETPETGTEEPPADSTPPEIPATDDKPEDAATEDTSGDADAGAGETPDDGASLPETTDDGARTTRLQPRNDLMTEIERYGPPHTGDGALVETTEPATEEP